MSKFDANKFKFKETFTNTNGKTSGSGFIGVILGLVAAASFIAAMIGYFFEIPNTIEVMEQMLKLIAASTILLGVRKVAPRFGNGKEKPNGNDDTIVKPLVDDKG
jgi:zinc transporter ZupT